jgi:histidinol-phosphatase (PHP family)
MLFNYHTHTTFSDGKNTPEEIIEFAIENGIKALGFSDHAFTEHDQRYCMKDTNGYIKEIKRLKEKYADKIQIYLGIEEDATFPVNRSDFDYIIGSLHYIYFNGKYYPLDSNYDYFSVCAELFNGDDLAFAEYYYKYFCQYLEKRKPDIIGHFDVITKFDEKYKDRFLHDEKYWRLAEKYLERVIKFGCIFEINTGLISRGFRSSPCPHDRLLKIIAKHGGRVTLSSDAHQTENLCSYFDNMKVNLKNIGFDAIYCLFNGEWLKIKI